jgi:hypothetical protein
MAEENIQVQSEESNESSSEDLMSAFDDLDGSEPQGEGESEAGINLDESGDPWSQFEIDERFKDLPKPEAVKRTYQSKFDKLQSQNEQNLRKVEEASKITTFFDELLEDDEVFEAFVAERKPELISNRNNADAMTARIKKQLEEEFGDYKPTREEAEEDPGGRAWLYFKKLDKLYDQMEQGSSKVKTLKELRAERAALKKEQEEKVNRQIQEVQQQMKWNDEQLDSFKEWAQKLSIPMLAKMYNFATKTMRIPGAATVPGGATRPSAREQFLKGL